MTQERFKWYQAEIARLREMDKRRADKVRASYTIKQKCTLPGCCSLEN